MDIFDQVREIRPTYSSSAQAPRRALHREIARSQRTRPLRRVALVSLGGAAAAAAVVTAVAVSPPGLAPQPDAASAAVYLTETAAAIRAGGSTAGPVTIVNRQLGLVGGPNAPFAPFGDIRAGATGAVVSESSATYESGSDGWPRVISGTEFHSRDVYGDQAVVADAWNDYYGGTLIGELGQAPETGATFATPLPEESLPVMPASFPAGGEAFLAAWTQGMDDLMAARMTEAAALVEGDPEASGIYDPIRDEYAVPAAEHMISTLATSPLVHTAPSAYRATFLEALALAPGITVEEGSASVKVLSYASEEKRYRLSIDPAAGAILQIDEHLLKVPGAPWSNHTKNDAPVDVGSASFLPEDIASRSWVFHWAP